ncbi:MAG TPA: hypothetical protein VKV32_11740 [Stellaceae bacterium]|nr:hypothetical protein [Stellaceae bacterium]
MIDKTQRKIRFACARWAAEQDAFALKRNRRAVDSDHCGALGALLFAQSQSVWRCNFAQL